MKKDTIEISRVLLESIIKENLRLKEELSIYKPTAPLQPQILDNQISIDEYIKKLKKGKKKDEWYTIRIYDGDNN